MPSYYKKILLLFWFGSLIHAMQEENPFYNQKVHSLKRLCCQVIAQAKQNIKKFDEKEARIWRLIEVHSGEEKKYLAKLLLKSIPERPQVKNILPSTFLRYRLSPDGSRAFVQNLVEGLLIYKIKTGTLLCGLPAAINDTFGWSKTGKFIYKKPLVGECNNILLHDRNGMIVNELSLTTPKWKFTPLDSYIIAKELGGIRSVYDTRTAKRCANLGKPDYDVKIEKQDPQEKYIPIVQQGNTQLYSTCDFKCCKTFPGTLIGFSNDKIIISNGIGIDLYDHRTLQLFKSINIPLNSSLRVGRINTNNNRIQLVGNSSIVLCDMIHGTCIAKLEKPLMDDSQKVHFFSGDLKKIIEIEHKDDDYSNICLKNIDGKIIKKILVNQPFKAITAFRYTPHSHYVFLGDCESVSFLVDVERGIVHAMPCMRIRIPPFSHKIDKTFSCDGKWIEWYYQERKDRVWQLPPFINPKNTPFIEVVAYKVMRNNQENKQPIDNYAKNILLQSSLMPLRTFAEEL